MQLNFIDQSEKNIHMPINLNNLINYITNYKMQIILTILATMVFLALLSCLLFFFKNYKGQTMLKNLQSQIIKKITKKPDYFKSSHVWQEQKKAGLYYCNICSKLMGGLFKRSLYDCMKCGLMAHPVCIRF